MRVGWALPITWEVLSTPPQALSVDTAMNGPTMPEYSERFFRSGTLRIHFRDWGNPDASPLGPFTL